ncbi:hypothetical protein TNCV_844091 [Trichonephila clavipes]|nr:hypothetical protein TNCV_844091 [Trichonephila clavipes]
MSRLMLCYIAICDPSLAIVQQCISKKGYNHVSIAKRTKSIHTHASIAPYEKVDERFSIVHVDLIGLFPPEEKRTALPALTLVHMLY